MGSPKTQILRHQGTAQSRTGTSGGGTSPKLPCSTVPLLPSSRSPHYGLKLNLPTSTIPAPIPQCCSAASHCPVCPYIQGCSIPRGRIQHLSLLKFLWLVIAQPLPWSLQGPPSLEGVYSSSRCRIVSIAGLPGSASSPVSRSLMKMLKRVLKQ